MKIYIVNGKACYYNFQPIPEQVLYMMTEQDEITEVVEVESHD
jgi:hypothetical protein